MSTLGAGFDSVVPQISDPVMDDLEFSNPASPLFHHPVLQEARRGFVAFYTTASTNDQQWMDTLVLAHVTFNQAFGVRRDLIPAAERPSLERVCDKVELEFMRAREP